MPGRSPLTESDQLALAGHLLIDDHPHLYVSVREAWARDPPRTLQ